VLALDPVGTELAGQHPTVGFEPAESSHDLVGRRAQAGSYLADQERTVGAGVPGHQLDQGFGDRLGERRRQPDR
jgi:hypothetical protein